MATERSSKSRKQRVLGHRSYEIPPVVDAAQAFLDWTYNHRLYVPSDAVGQSKPELNTRELRTYDAALDVLFNYFRQEEKYVPPFIVDERQDT